MKANYDFRHPLPNVDTTLDVRLALSNGGQWYALAESASGKSNSLPNVEVCSTTDPNDDRAKDLDFIPYKEEFQSGWKISAMSFDREANTLVVGFEGKTFLLTFDLHSRPPAGCELQWVSSGNVSSIPAEGKNLIVVAEVNNVLHFRIFDPAGQRVVDTEERMLTHQAGRIGNLKKQLETLRPPHELAPTEKSQVIATIASIVAVSRKLTFGTPVREWAHGPHGNLAVATTVMVWDGNLYGLSEGKPPDLKPVSGHELSCVALSPKGTILVTGDENHAITVRLLGEPHRGAEMIRLAHVGRIMKLGFSPDGRVLAALAETGDRTNGVAQGIIRLWSTGNWVSAVAKQ